MKHRPARAKVIVVIFVTLMAILHSLNHSWRFLSYLTSGVGLRDVAIMGVSSASCGLDAVRR